MKRLIFVLLLFQLVFIGACASSASNIPEDAAFVSVTREVVEYAPSQKVEVSVDTTVSDGAQVVQDITVNVPEIAGGTIHEMPEPSSIPLEEDYAVYESLCSSPNRKFSSSTWKPPLGTYVLVLCTWRMRLTYTVANDVPIIDHPAHDSRTSFGMVPYASDDYGNYDVEVRFANVERGLGYEDTDLRIVSGDLTLPQNTLYVVVTSGKLPLEDSTGWVSHKFRTGSSFTSGLSVTDPVYINVYAP